MLFKGHGDKDIIERVMQQSEAKTKIRGLTRIEVSGRVARECIDIAYGFFTPLEGFAGREDVESICNKMVLSDGTLWPIPIILDINEEEVHKKRIKEGDTILLTYSGNPLATLEVEEIFRYNKMKIAEAVLGTADEKHPGVRMMIGLENTFLGGKVTLVSHPKFQSPFDRFWYTPRRMREIFAEKGWKRVVAHQTRNVPHSGHEWLMKGAWFSANGELPVEKLETGILVNCIIGPKRTGDYIDEAIVLCHQQLNEHGDFRKDVHMVSFALWDMRYAGPKEAIFHAILRTNLGCTHQMFGRDHAGVGSYYDPYDAHRIFDQIPENKIKIKPVSVLHP